MDPDYSCQQCGKHYDTLEKYKHHDLIHEIEKLQSHLLSQQKAEKHAQKYGYTLSKKPKSVHKPQAPQLTQQWVPVPKGEFALYWLAIAEGFCPACHREMATTGPTSMVCDFAATCAKCHTTWGIHTSSLKHRWILWRDAYADGSTWDWEIPEGGTSHWIGHAKPHLAIPGM